MEWHFGVLLWFGGVLTVFLYWGLIYSAEQVKKEWRVEAHSVETWSTSNHFSTWVSMKCFYCCVKSRLAKEIEATK